MRLEKIRKKNLSLVKNYTVKQLSFFKTFAVLELKSGTVYMETTDIDEDGVETIELLVSRDRKHFTFISRSRSGGSYHPMKNYARDSKFPLHSIVKV